ncbi:MAG: hypothetical protein Q8M07_00250, partial [Prosthecobacter sp.]|nr:hypothetical protein [Prosthecobacter sp.]
MNVHYTPLIARWPNGAYSIHFGTGEDEDVFTILDELGDPSGVEVRTIPGRFAGFLSMAQSKR